MERIYPLYRCERWLYLHHLKPMAFVVRGMMRIVFSCDIPYKATIGKGAIFPHDALCVVIHPNAVIGNNVKILHGVTIGGRGKNERVPRIGDDVLIGLHAQVLGDINIGDHAVIAAGAVVIHDVPACATVAGVPAVVIKVNREIDNMGE